MKFKQKAILFAAVFLMIYCGVGLARADDFEITWQGRTEPAQCEFKYIDPVVETCVTESWVCRIQGGDMQCEVKR